MNINNITNNKDKQFEIAQREMAIDKISIGIISLVSVLVLAFLVWLVYFKDPAVQNFWWVDTLPGLNATLNSITAILLIMGYRFIKKGKKKAHIRTMLFAVCTSGIFLISYILYHHFHGDSKYLGVGVIRYVYFFILISHILLSMIMVPMIFTTLYFGLRKKLDQHKKIARKTFPIWLYVSVTGVIIFVMLKN